MIWFWQFLLIIYGVGYVVTAICLLAELWPARRQPFEFRPREMDPLALLVVVLLTALVWPVLLVMAVTGR